jgi:hypothetical protein
MDRLGTISFQANDSSDVFLVEEVRENNLEPSDENLLDIEDVQFDANEPWVTGRVPKMEPIVVEGDTTIINVWFKGEVFDAPFVITIYVECEEAETLVDVEVEKEEGADEKSDLEPQILEL